MYIINQIMSNHVLICSVTAWLIAQIIKTVIDLLYTRTISFERMWGSGGMPSAHSATVCSLMVSSGYHYGIGSFEFAICFIFATIVMHDAIGVRRETGKQAKLLNLIMESSFMEINGIEDFQVKLKELVGHTPLQVLMGGVLGIIVSVVMNTLTYAH